MDPSVSSESKELYPVEVYVKEDISIKDEDHDFCSMNYENSAIENQYNTYDSAEVHRADSVLCTSSEDTKEEEEVQTQVGELTQEEEVTIVAPPTGRRKRPGRVRKKGPCVVLTGDQERMLGVWLEDEVPFIYNKGLKLHADRQKVAQVFENKAKTLKPPLTGHQLATWFESIRSRYGRITNSEEKSGQAVPQELTTRERWIQAHFSFLRPHIIRQRKTKVIGVQPTAAPTADPPSDPSTSPTSPPEVRPPAAAAEGTALDEPRPNPTKAKQDQRASLLEQIVDQNTQFQSVVARAKQPASEGITYWRNVLSEVAKDCAELPRSFRTELIIEIWCLVNRWVALAASGATDVPPGFLINLQAKMQATIGRLTEVGQTPAPPPQPPTLQPGLSTTAVQQPLQVVAPVPGHLMGQSAIQPSQVQYVYQQPQQQLQRQAPRPLTASTPMDTNQSLNVSLPSNLGTSFILDKFPSLPVVGSPAPLATPATPSHSVASSTLNTPQK